MIFEARSLSLLSACDRRRNAAQAFAFAFAWLDVITFSRSHTTFLE